MPHSGPATSFWAISVWRNSDTERNHCFLSPLNPLIRCRGGQAKLQTRKTSAARTSSFLARLHCKRANPTIFAGSGAAAKSQWVPKRSYAIQRGGVAQKRREAVGEKNLAVYLPGTICFLNSHRGLRTRTRPANVGI